MARPRIGILTGGGDVPGLNSVIKSVTYRAHRAGLRGPGHPPRLGGPDAPAPRRRARRQLRRPARPHLDARHRPHRRHRAPHLADEPAQDAAPIGCRRTSMPDSAASMTTDGELYDLTPRRAREHRAPGPRLPGAHRWRRHALSFAQTLHDARRAARRHPQDDGQRRPGHRVLHRLLDGDHARQGAHQPAAHDARLARAHRRLPHLRPRLRLHRALHRVRDLGPLPHPGGALRPRPAGDASCWSRIMPTTPATTPSSSPPKGAIWKGGTIPEVGEADAFGHRHKANIAEVLAAEVKSPHAASRRSSPT